MLEKIKPLDEIEEYNLAALVNWDNNCDQYLPENRIIDLKYSKRWSKEHGTDIYTSKFKTGVGLDIEYIFQKEMFTIVNMCKVKTLIKESR